MRHLLVALTLMTPVLAADRLPFAFEARWKNAMQELELMALTMAPPVVVKTERMLPPAVPEPPVRKIRKVRIAERADTCRKHGQRKVMISRYKWRCRT